MLIKTELQLKLIDFRKSLDLNQTDFADSLGVSQGTIANMESGKREVSKPLLLKIKEIYNVDLLSFREEKNKINLESSNIIPIPFYDVRVSAGTGQPTSEYEEKDLMYFDKRWVRNVLGANPDNLSIVKVSGDSMDGGTHPIKDGDLIMVDHSIKEGNNKVFAFKENNELYVKKLCWNFDGSLTIMSYNPSPQYKTRTLSAESSEYTSLEIIGKVIWNGSKENV